MNQAVAERMRPDRGITDPIPFSATDTRGALAPRNVGEAMELAKIMAQGHFCVPKHLENNPSACLRIVFMGKRYDLDPFMIADGSAIINNRLAFEAKVIHAMGIASGAIGRFDLQFKGAGEALECMATNTVGGQSRSKTYRLKDITVRNSPLWKTDPEQQLGYYAERAWCRLYAPDAIMGLVAREEEGMLDVTAEPVVVPTDPVDVVRQRLEAPLPESAPEARAEPEADAAPEPQLDYQEPDNGGGATGEPQPVPGPSGTTEDLFTQGQARCAGGIAALQGWFSGLPKPDQAAIKPRLEDLKLEAEAADAQRKREADAAEPTQIDPRNPEHVTAAG